jgi:DNA-binding GntR family transcriptional regulator
MVGKPSPQNPSISQLTLLPETITSCSRRISQAEFQPHSGRHPQTIQDFEMANRAFHHALVAPCAMPRLLASLDGLQLANSRLLFAMARSAGWRPRSHQDHRLILQALRARNVDQACNLLARHIQTIERLALPAS